jgi:hypothetical protein
MPEAGAIHSINGVHLLDLLGPIGYVPPAEAEEAFYANLNTLDMVA